MSTAENPHPFPVSAISVDETWTHLWRHLDWMRGLGSVVFVAAQSRVQIDDLRDRVALWCRRVWEAWAAPKPTGLAQWLHQSLPQPGVVWVELWDQPTRIKVLHALNELRIRLAEEGAGCVVLLGPPPMFDEAATEAADLWSVRSLAYLIGAPLEPAAPTDYPTEKPETPAAAPKYRSAWRLTVPEELRSPETAALVRQIERARRRLPGDPGGALRILGRIPQGAPLEQVLVGIARAEIAGLRGEVIAAEANLQASLAALRPLPMPFQRQTFDDVFSVAMAAGALDAAEAACSGALRLDRDLADTVRTPESQRDLALSHVRLGDIAHTRGDLTQAHTHYTQALTINRTLADTLGTPESQRDLARTLHLLAEVFDRQGQPTGAAKLRQEAEEILDLLPED